MYGGQTLDHTLNILWTLLVAFTEEDLEMLAPDPNTNRSDSGRGATVGRMTFPRGHEDFSADDNDEHRWENFNSESSHDGSLD